MRIIFYVHLFYWVFDGMRHAASRPKDRNKLFESKGNEDIFDFKDLRVKAKKFDVDTPDAQHKIIAELRNAHGRNMQLQSYISDLLDIWIFRDSLKDGQQPTTNKHADAKKPTGGILQASSGKEAVQQLNEGIQKITLLLGKDEVPSTAEHDAIPQTLKLIESIRMQAAFVLKRVDELEAEILNGTSNARKNMGRDKKTVTCVDGSKLADQRSTA